MKTTKDPLAGPLGAVAKFVGAGLFGGFVSLVVFLGILWLDVDAFWQSPWPHVLWIIPVMWGVLGIFWFDKMLDAARKIFEGFFGIESE